MGGPYKNKKIDLGHLLTSWASVLATVAIFLYFSASLPGMFLTGSNLITILRSVCVTTVIAIGITVTTAAGGFDLSAGALATMSGTFAISFFVWKDWNVWVVIPAAILASLALTGITLFMIIQLHIPDLLATMAMMFILQGLSQTYAGGGSITQGMTLKNGQMATGIVPEVFKKMGQTPWIIIIMAAAVLIVFILLNYTKYGRYIYAIGSNYEAAKLSGISVKKYRIIAGLIAGAFVALGGILVASRNAQAAIQAADGYLMPAISAVVIGQSVAGNGKANAIGTFVGALLVGILENGLVMMSVPYYALNMIKGIVLAVALASAYFIKKD